MGFSLGGILGGIGAITGNPWLIGAGGLLGASDAQREQRRSQENAINAAKDSDRPRLDAAYSILDLAKRYDPVKEGQSAVDEANRVTGENLRTNLSRLRSDFMLAGGSPAGDTEFAVRAQDVTNRTMDPLRQFMAQLRSEETMKKIGALQAVANVPAGQLSNAYFTQAAQNGGGDFGPSIALLAQALKRGGGGGAGGTGDKVAIDPNWSRGGWA